MSDETESENFEYVRDFLYELFGFIWTTDDPSTFEIDALSPSNLSKIRKIVDKYFSGL